MTEEDISFPSGNFRDPSADQQALETLIVIAHSQGRNFLPILIMVDACARKISRTGPPTEVPTPLAGSRFSR
jgi:hypothetical protein